jgi:hypothetical protein
MHLADRPSPLRQNATVGGVNLTDLRSLIPILVIAYGVIVGAAALATGWRTLTASRAGTGVALWSLLPTPPSFR